MSRTTVGNAIWDHVAASVAKLDELHPDHLDAYAREFRRKIDLCRAELPAPPAGFEWWEHFHDPEPGIEAWTIRVSFHLHPVAQPSTSEHPDPNLH